MTSKIPKALVFDHYCLTTLFSNPLPEEFWTNFELPEESINTDSILYNGIRYIIGTDYVEQNALLVMDLKAIDYKDMLNSGGIFDCFHRIRQTALSHFEHGVKLPTKDWKFWHDGNKCSFYAYSRQKADGTRLFIEKNSQNTNHVFLFASADADINIALVKKDDNIFEECVLSIDDAIENGERNLKTESDFVSAIELGLHSTFKVTGQHSIEEWYNNFLTKEQLDFVKLPIFEKPARLKGAAGTGKTLALIVKFAKDTLQLIKEKREARLLFLTHSDATKDMVRTNLFYLDPHQKMFSSDEVTCELKTLYQLSAEEQFYDRDVLQPISSDGAAARDLQRELILSVTEEYFRSDYMTMKYMVTPAFDEKLKRIVQKKNFDDIWELQTEFACVLDADKVVQSETRRLEYLSGKRSSVMMHLSNEAERKVVFDIYLNYRKVLTDMDVLSVDSMMSDYLGYLSSHRWTASRLRRGYDAIFVDEMHLFNRQERMVFHQLGRNGESILPVFMAYDFKQNAREIFGSSVSDRFSAARFWRDLQLGGIEGFELTEVFRYSVEIARFLADIDASYPAIDLGEEFHGYDFHTDLVGNNIPIIVDMKTQLDMYNNVFNRAAAISKGKNIGSVAILCLNEEVFTKYISAGSHKDKFYPIASREDVTGIRSSRKNIILSMPEYVNGLQFDSVMLLDANENDLPGTEDPRRAGKVFQFLRRLYLGASRARKQLEIYSVRERGGRSKLLAKALTNNSLLAVKWSDLN